MPKITIADLKTCQDEIETQFGFDAQIAYANVTYTQMSIARHYGGLKVNGHQFNYNVNDDSLIREDVAKFTTKLLKVLKGEASLIAESQVKTEATE